MTDHKLQPAKAADPFDAIEDADAARATGALPPEPDKPPMAAPSHAFARGDTVTVFNAEAGTGRPMIEGQGEILAPMDRADFYKVSVTSGEGEAAMTQVCERFIPDLGQKDPEGFLADALAEWEKSQAPAAPVAAPKAKKARAPNKIVAGLKEAKAGDVAMVTIYRLDGEPVQHPKGAELPEGHFSNKRLAESARNAGKAPAPAKGKGRTPPPPRAPVEKVQAWDIQGKEHSYPADQPRPKSLYPSLEAAREAGERPVTFYGLNGVPVVLRNDTPQAELVARQLYPTKKAARAAAIQAAAAAKRKKEDAARPARTAAAPKAASAPKAARAAPAGGPTKRDQVIAMLTRPGGASAAEITEAVQWQAHSIRGFIAGTVKRLTDPAYDVRAETEKATGLKRYWATVKAEA